MDRYGAPRFRGSSNAGYGRQPPSTHSAMLTGVSPHTNAGQGQANRPQQSILKNSRGNDWQGARSSGSILGAPPPKSAASRDGYGGARGGTWDERKVKSTEGRKSDEVSQLMKSLGLSQSDIQKLSQMPDHEINVNNLARAIGDLKKGQPPYSSGGSKQPRSSSMYDPSHPTDDDYDAPRQGGGRYQSDRSQYQRSSAGSSGILGESPYSRSAVSSYNKESATNYKPAGSARPLLVRKPASSMRDDDPYDRRDRRNVEQSRNDDDSYYSRGDDRDRPYRSSSDQYSHSRNDSFRTKRIVEEINDDRQGHGSFGRSPRNEPMHKSAPQRQPPRGPYRSPDGRSQDKHWSRGGASNTALLGNPLQPNSRGLENLAASVGRTPSSLSVTQAATTVLNPLLLAQQTDPAVLEVQLQAIKVLQAEALKQQQNLLDKSVPKQMPSSRGPMSQSDKYDRHDEIARRNAKKEADEMRAMGCRVLYMRFKSNRIQESDLRQLATAFGRVTNVLIVRSKVPNGFNQAFMEMQQADCAAAMVEHYKAKQPVVLGCNVLVDRSNYRDLTIRESEQRKRGRSRSISPIRKGTTQLPSKRLRAGKLDPPRLNVSVSDNRRLVTRGSAKTPPKDSHDARNDIKKSTRRSGSLEKRQKSMPAQKDAPDARREYNRRRSANAKKGPEKRDSKEKADPKSAAKESEKGTTTSASERRSASKEKEPEKKEEKQESKSEAEKTQKDTVEADPLDEIADELLQDDFGLMEEDRYDEDDGKDVTADGEMEDKPKEIAALKEEGEGAAKEDIKTLQDDHDVKENVHDLDRKDLDLEDINVDMSQDEEDEDKSKKVKEEFAPVKEEFAPVKEKELLDQVKEEAESIEGDDNTDEVDPSNAQDPEMEYEASAAEPEGSNTDEETNAAEGNEAESCGGDALLQQENTETHAGNTKNVEPKETSLRDEGIEAEEELEVDDQTTADKTTAGESLNCEETGKQHSEQEEEEISQEFASDQEDTQDKDEEEKEAPAFSGDNINHEDEVACLKLVIKSTRQEVLDAMEQLVALNKTTKNRATVAASKKLKACLEGAIARLDSAQPS